MGVVWMMWFVGSVVKCSLFRFAVSSNFLF
jgi:hypothetical protein